MGGVCAFAIENPDTKVYCDMSLKRFDYVYPACGSANSAIKVSPAELFSVSEALDWIDISKLPEGAV